MYSEEVRRLLAELPNRGPLIGATAERRVENPVCGDVVELQLRVAAGRIEECRFLAEGCPAALASAAAITELVHRMPVDWCRRLTVEMLLERLGGLPSHKRHGAELAIEALRGALASEGRASGLVHGPTFPPQE